MKRFLAVLGIAAVVVVVVFLAVCVVAYETLCTGNLHGMC